MVKSADISRKNILLFAVAEIAILSLTGLLSFKGKNIKTIAKEKLMKKTINKERLMKDIVSKILTSHSLEEAIKNISTEMGQLFDADRVHFRFYDSSIGSFSKVIEEYRRNDNVPSAKEKMLYPKEFDQFLSDQVFARKNIFFINDPNDPKYPESFRNLFDSLDIKNEIIVPILYDDIPEGAFFITNTEYAEEWSRKDIEELLPIFQQIAIGTHLFRLNDNLMRTSEYDRILREIINEVRRYEEPEEVFSYLIYRLSDLFHIDRVLDLKSNEDRNLYVFNEQLKDPSLGKLKDQVIFYESDFQKLSELEEKRIIVVNDICDIDVPIVRDYLRKINIGAFLLYPITEIIPELKVEKVTNRIMICSPTPRLWTSEEIDALKLIVGTIAVIFVEIRKRKELQEVRQTFLATLTHDLKSPLLAEQKALEMMLSAKPETPLGDFKEYLSDIHSTNDELLRIVTNILTVNHVETGKFELHIEPHSIKDIISEAIKPMRHLAEDQDSEINTEIQDDLPLVALDVTEITRVIVNLLNNAIKHNQKGTNIIIKANKTDNQIQVSISDNGKGIPEEEKPYIFQRYPTTKRKIGTGLGLYLSKQIIEAHHGRIWFETEKGKGTTFFFTLPISVGGGGSSLIHSPLVYYCFSALLTVITVIKKYRHHNCFSSKICTAFMTSNFG